MDVFTKEERSQLMSKIRGKDTKPELIVRRFLHSKGLRYRLHNNNLPGNPDMALKKYSSVIFVNGCFWHGHEHCKYFKLPNSNADFWKQKIQNTKSRDEIGQSRLIEAGWKVYVVWECELKANVLEKTLNDLYFDIIS